MNKSDLTKALAKEYNLNLRKAEEIVDKFVDTMAKALMTGDHIEIRGLGSFIVKEYEGYKGRNPKTGEKIPVASKRLPFFKCGKDLREQVNQR
jgi:integration host factor subunit beta